MVFVLLTCGKNAFAGNLLFLGEITVITAGGLEYHQGDILSRKRRKVGACLDMRISIRQLFMSLASNPLGLSRRRLLGADAYR
jgi:hypothetical protein